MVMPFAPVVVTDAPARMSAATGGAVPARFTDMHLFGLAEVPGKLSVTAPAVLSAWSDATQKSSPAAEPVIAVVSVVAPFAHVS